MSRSQACEHMWVPLTWRTAWECWDPSPMEQVTSQTSVSRELRSWSWRKGTLKIKSMVVPEHSGNAHTKPGTPRNKKKSKQALHNVGSGSKHTSCTGQQGLRIQQGWAGQRWEPSLERLGCLVWLSQPGQSEIVLLTEWKFWLHMAPLTSDPPLLTAGKFIFRDFPTSLTLPKQRVRSHPAITTLVLRRLFILFHLGLVAHAHWSRALL